MRVSYHCQPMRSGLVVAWMIDGTRHEQTPPLRFYADQTILEVEWEIGCSVAAIAVIDGNPSRCMMPFGETTDNEASFHGSGGVD